MENKGIEYIVRLDGKNHRLSFSKTEIIVILAIKTVCLFGAVISAMMTLSFTLDTGNVFVGTAVGVVVYFVVLKTLNFLVNIMIKDYLEKKVEKKGRNEA